MSKKAKYITINVCAIILFLGLYSLVELSINSNNFFNYMQTVLSDINMIFPYIFYGIMTMIDINSNNEVTKFGNYSRYTYFFIASLVLVIGVITTIIWYINGTTGTVYGPWVLSWNYNYLGNLFLFFIYSIIIAIIGLCVNTYIRIISNTLLYIYNKNENIMKQRKKILTTLVIIIVLITIFNLLLEFLIAIR